MTRCLYLVYWGATEPLGRALVLPVVHGLAERGEEVFLVTYDKPADTADAESTATVRRELERRGIRWKNLVYHKRPRNVSTAWDILRGVLFGAWWIVRHRIRVVHARTYVGGIVGWLLGLFLPVRVVFHNEGFWPEEQLDNRIWQPTSAGYRLASWIARSMYRRADAIVALSRRARSAILSDPVVARRGRAIAVVGSCIDVDRFERRSGAAAEGDVGLIYLGSLGGRYLVDELFDFMRVAKTHVPRTRLRIATRSDREALLARAAARGIAPGDIEIGPADADEVPALLRRHHAAVFLLAEGRSNIATSATKVGEYLAAGLPVAVTPNCGDVDLIVSETRTGTVVREHTEAAYGAALRDLLDLIRDPELPSRCREAAVRHYGLEQAVSTQLALHVDLARR